MLDFWALAAPIMPSAGPSESIHFEGCFCRQEFLILTQKPIPIGSMGLAYLLTFMVVFYGIKYRYISDIPWDPSWDQSVLAVFFWSCLGGPWDARNPLKFS